MNGKANPQGCPGGDFVAVSLSGGDGGNGGGGSGCPSQDEVLALALCALAEQSSGLDNSQQIVCGQLGTRYTTSGACPTH